MKSHQLLTKSSQPATSPRFMRRASGSLLAAALLFSLGHSQLLAQGAYYPTLNPNGGTATAGTAFPGAPGDFEPLGTPITSAPELSLINYHLGLLHPTKSLILPPPAGLSSPTATEYNNAVREAAKAVANGSGPVGITITSLSGEVAKYGSTPSFVDPALGALAKGVITSMPSVALRQAMLEEIGKGVVLANPANVTGTSRLQLVFQEAASDKDFIQGVGAILKSALDNSSGPAPGTPAGSPAASSITPTNVNIMVADAINKIHTGALLLGVMSPASGPVIVQNTIAGGALGSANVANSVANLDAATQAVMAYNTGGLVTQQAMLGSIQTAAVAAASDVKKGAIAQGALRVPGVLGANITAVLTGTYVMDLVTIYGSLPGVPPGSIVSTGGANTAAAGAAAMVKYGSTNPNTSAGITAVFAGAPPLSGADVRSLLETAAGANQSKASLIATTSVGLGVAPAAPEDVAFGAIKGAQISQAGAIANAVIALPSVSTQAAWVAVGSASATAAGSAGAVSVAYNVAAAVKAKPADTLANNTAVMNAIATAMGATDDYLGVIAYVAGNNKANPGLSGTAVGLTPAESAAVATSNTLINNYNLLLLNNYDKTYGALIGSTTVETTKGALTAASLANSGDAVGALAAATLVAGGGAVSLDQLTTLAVRANPTKQFSLTLGAAVASAVASPTANIQQIVGRHVIENQSNIVDVATAATTVKAQFSHFVAHAVAFNAPTTVHSAVSTILTHSRITRAGQLTGADIMGAGGRPAALAAIGAGLTTGLRENRQLTPLDFKNALYTTVYALVNQVYSQGAFAPYTYTDASPGAAVFRQSNGGVGTFTTVKASGIAGAVTGFVAQMVAPGDHLLALNADLANALRGAYLGSGSATNQLVVGQAAGQAFGWVSGAANAAAAIGGGGIPTAIATAMVGGVPPAALVNAVNFGFNEAAGGEIVGNPARRPGAGAAGLRDIVANPTAPYYDHHNATGTPVSNIFSL